MRQKLASVELGSPSLSLMRRNGFSPVRINLCGSATLISISPCSSHVAEPRRQSGVPVDCRQSLAAYAIGEAHLFSFLLQCPSRNRNGNPALQWVEAKPFGRPGMGDLFRRGAAIFVAGVVGATPAATLALSRLAQAPSEPPGRVGRLAFTDGAVSFHDNEQSEWAPAVVNTPLSTGDSLWTEANARSEISLAGTRIRMAGATELDMLAVDAPQTRLQVDQGRIDVKTQAMDPSQPYQIMTPRGTISLLQQGDYYVEAGSTEDPTQIGVRSGAAQIQGLNGQVLAVRPGEGGEGTGDGATPPLRTT